jgi:hypothetical protein
VTDENARNGNHAAMEAERRRWLERVIGACERVAAEVPDPNDPYLRTLLEDVEALRSRLVDELRAGEAEQ